MANNTQISKQNRTITTQGASDSRPKVETFVLQWSNQHGKRCDKRKGLESDQGTAAPSEKANSGECSGTPPNLEEWCYLVCQCSETCPRKSAHLLSQLAFAGKEASLRGLRPPSKLGPTRLSYSGSTRLSSPPESTIPLLLAPCSWVWFRLLNKQRMKITFVAALELWRLYSLVAICHFFSHLLQNSNWYCLLFWIFWFFKI